MADRVKISGGRLVDPASGSERVADLYIADGRIVGVDTAPAGFEAQAGIDASGMVVCPGLVDLAVRLGSSLESELGAALAGGVTSVACPPDMDPPLDEPGLVEMLARRAESLALSHVYPVGALTQGLAGSRLAEMNELAEAGCVAFSQADEALADNTVLLRALQYAATFDLPVWLRPQDASLARHGVAHDGEIATRLGLPGIPALAETIAVSTILLMVAETGARVHLCRLSAGESVDLVRDAKARGLTVTCDVSAHHVHLSEMDIGYFDAHCRLTPPLRSLRDRDALVRGLADGTIDAVCSDHCPMAEDGKEVPFGEATPGATGLELLLPLTLRWGGSADLASTLRPVTIAPARILGLPQPSLELGAPADLCIFDPAAWWRVGPETLRSRGRNTPFSGYEVQGRVRYTLVGGRIVFEQ